VCTLLLKFSPFEIVYGFNPLTPMDLIPLSIDERVSLDGNRKTQVVKTLHESVRQHIKKRNRVYATKANKGCKHVVFQPGDWVWMHMRKERFPAHRKSKLQPRGDGPFLIRERINDNVYKVDLSGELCVSVTFNVSDLTLFDVGDDSRSNPFEERGDDADPLNTKCNHANDPLEVPIGPITRARAKKLKEALNGLVHNIWSKMDLEGLETFKEHEGQTLIHLVQVQEEPNSCGARG